MPEANSTALPSTSTWSRSRLTLLIRSSFRGVRDSETRVAMRVPGRKIGAAGCPGPISSTVPSSMPPEPVTGLWSLPRRPTMSRMASAIRPGTVPPDRATSSSAAFSSCVKLAASTLSVSTRISSSPSPMMGVLSMRHAGWGKDPWGSMLRWLP